MINLSDMQNLEQLLISRLSKSDIKQSMVMKFTT